MSKRQLRFLWGRLNSSFWFVPALMTGGSVVLFFLTQYLDVIFKLSVSELPLVFSGGADSARSVLGSVSGAMITVTVTSFSLAIVVLQLASSQYTPRVIQTFLADRGMQTVLGAFLGTFVYSLLVLRIIRTSTGATEAFVPVISLTTAVLFTLVCVGLLIYFIHHIADLIQSSTVVQSAHWDSLRAIEQLEDLESHDGDGAEDDGSRFPESSPVTLVSRRSGYVQHLELESIVEAFGGSSNSGSTDAGESEPEAVFVDLPYGPGFFVSAGMPLVRLWTADGAEPGPAIESKVRRSMVIGKERSFQQDFAFGLRQLSDIALLGLSPGVNDPTSAMQAMDRTEAILISLGGKRLPRILHEYQGSAREITIRVGHYSFDDVVGLGLDQIRRSAFTSGQVAVLDRFLEVVDRALRANPILDRQHALWERAFAVARLAPQEITDPRDAGNLALHAIKVAAPLLETGMAEKVSADLRVLAHSCEGLPGAGLVEERVEAALSGSNIRAGE